MSKKIKIFLLGCALMVMCCMGITAGASDNAKVIAHNLTITDEGISVNFYVDIDVEAQNDIKVTLNGSQVEIPAEPTEIIIDAKAYSCYKFTQPVVAKEMDDKVSLSIVAGEEELVTDSYSVNDYVAEVQAGGYSYNFENLANAMTYYGEFAEVYLKYNNATSASEKALASINGFNEEVLDAYAMTKGSEYPEGLTYYGTQLNLNSEITLRLCFQLADGKTAADYGNITAVSIDGTKDLGVLKKGSYKDTQYYYVDIANIGADVLGKSYEIKAGDKTLLSNCSVLSYANAVVNKYGSDAAKVDLANLSKALYLYSEKANLYVESKLVAVYDIFYGSEGFSATPDKFTPVYLTSNGDVTTESTGNTQVTTLSQLNDSRTKGCSVWMKEAYTPTEEVLAGPYVIRRYAGNTGNVLNVTGTATFETTVDGSLGKFVAQYPGGTTEEFEISNIENGDIYVSGALTVKGSAKTGLITTSTADITITADGLTEEAEVIFPDHKSQKLAGTGEVSAIYLEEHGQGHFGAYETAEGLSLGSIICGCGANVSQDPTHSCAWTTAQGGVEAAYAIEWTATESFPTSAGSYYLTQNMTGVATRSQLDNVDAIINFDLAGHTVEGSGNAGMFYRVQAGTLNIADSSEQKTGAIKTTGTTNTYGSIAVWGGNKEPAYINIFGGTYSAITGTAVTLRRGYINMYGGTILPGEKPEGYAYANAVQVGIGTNQLTNLNVSGGTIKGEVFIQDTSNVVLSVTKDAQVGIKDENQPNRPYGIKATGTAASLWTINCEGLTDNATVVLENLADISITGNGDASAIEFKEDGAGHFGAYETAEGLKIGSVICGCGKNISQEPTHSCAWTTAQGGVEAAYALEWTELTETTTLPASGSYYLTEDLNGVNARRNIQDGNIVNLDLAGCTIEGTGDTTTGYIGMFYRVQQGTLNIADSSKDQTGAIYMSGETNDLGAMAVWTDDTSCMNIFGGTISAKTGTAVTIRTGHVNMYGGTILPGEKPEGYANANAVQIGTNQDVMHDLNVFGGTIKGEVLIKNKENITVTITGDAQVGIKDDNQPERPYGIKAMAADLTTINCEGLTDKATVVLENLADIPITGKGDASAIEFIEDGAGHFGAYETEEGLMIGSIICGCGANISQDPDHSCAWTTAQGGVEAAYALEWTATESFPISAGSYYLTQNMTGVATRSQLDNVDAIINFDLAGHTIEGSGNAGMFYRVQAGTLNIADSSEQKTGAIKMTGTTNTYGSMAVWGGNKEPAYINIFGGTYSAITGTVVTLRRGYVNMYGGTILPGEKPEGYAYANAVQVGIGTNQLTNLNVSGGTIKGEVLIYDTSGVTLTVIEDAQVGIKESEQSEKPYGIGTADTVTSAQAINFSNTSGNVVLKDTTYLALAEGATGDASKFTIIDKRNQVVNVDESETLGYAAYMCVCGKTDGRYDHTDGCEQPTYAWEPWTDSATLPTTEGSHYLTADVNVTGTRNNITGGIKVNLDLAGYTVTGAETTINLYRLQNGTLNIADSSEGKTGTIKAIGTSNMDAQPGRIIYVWGSGSGGKDSYANIFGGTFDASEAKAGYGTAITISKGSVSMYDGTILAGSVVEGHANSVEIGIASGTTSILNVKGGTIQGEVLYGIGSGAQLNVSGDAKVGIADENDENKDYGIGTVSTVTSAQTIVCDEVSADASVVIKNLDKVGATGTGEGSAFTILEIFRNQIADDNNDGIGNLVYVAYMCVCGKADGKYDHTDDCKKPAYAWEPWTSTTGLPTENGSFYLTQNLAGLTTRSQIEGGNIVNLDLAGYTVDGTGQGGLLYRIKRGGLNLADSSEEQTGKIYATGESTGVGRALYVWGTEGKVWYANIFGGTLTADTSVPVAISNGNIHMYGGTIEAGTSVEYSGTTLANSVQIGLVDGTTPILNVEGGTITGEVLLGNNNAELKISADAKVAIADDDANKAYGIGTTSLVTSAKTVECDNVSADASVVIKNSHDVTVSGTGEGSAFSIIDQHNKVVDDNTEGIGNLSFAPQMCVCGAVGEHTQIGNCAVPTSAWLPWNATISNADYERVQLPTTSESYYLTEDMSGDNAIVAQTSLTTQRLSIDLAGHTVDASDTAQRIFAMNDGSSATLNITDSVGGGVLKNAQQVEADVYDGKVIRVYSTDATVNLYAGILTAEGTNIAGEENNNACTVSIAYSDTFNMYGGTVVDNGGEGEDVFKAFNNHSKYNYVDGVVIEDGLYKRGDTANTFRAGYGKTNINPENGVSLGSYSNEDVRTSTGILSDLEAVAIAVTDAENNTLILVVTDLSWGRISDANAIRKAVSKKYGIPKENVLVGGTHNHSAPSAKYTTNELNVEYMEQWTENVMSAIDLAIRDRAEATMEVGTTETVDMVFSRRYLCEDGKYQGGGSSDYDETTAAVKEHESEADEEIQMLRFVREDATDILIAQWQSHACNISWDRTEGSDHYKASGEWPQIIRSTLEEELGVHCMYMQGAAGNLASMSDIAGENLSNATSDSEAGTIGYNDYVAIGEKVASYVSTAYNATNVFTEVESGLIQINQYKMPVTMRATDTEAEREATEAEKPELNTVAIGDVSLVTLPSELFDTSAKYVKTNTPFSMTLIMGYTCGGSGYEAPDEFWDNGCYEVVHGNYVRGTAELMMQHYVNKLTEFYATK